MKSLIRFLTIAVFCGTPFLAWGFGNEDVVELVAANFPVKEIMEAVDSANPATFDVGAKGLIALKNAGVPPEVVRQMQARMSQPASPTISVSDGTCPPDTGEGDGLAAKVGNKIVPLSHKEDARQQNVDALSTLGGALTRGLLSSRIDYSYIVRGERDAVRVTERKPEFINFVIPLEIRPEKVIQLVRMTAKDGSRSVQMTFSSSVFGKSITFPDGAFIPVTTGNPVKQCTWRGKSLVLYKVAPAAPLEPGEYGFPVGEEIYNFGVD